MFCTAIVLSLDEYFVILYSFWPAVENVCLEIGMRMDDKWAFDTGQETDVSRIVSIRTMPH